MLHKKITKRMENVGVRFNRKELDEIENLAEDDGIYVATWIRKIILKEMRDRKE